MYRKNAMRLTFSTATRTENDCRDGVPDGDVRRDVDLLREWPSAHQTTRYMAASMLLTSPSDHSQVGTRTMAPDAIVKTAIMQAVSAPNVTSGIEPS